MSNLSTKFISHWQTHFAHLLGKGSRVLVTVSGGVDSVVLLDLAIKAGLDVTVAHVNFGLRGEESERDEDFVRLLADKYKVPVLVKQFATKTYAEENKLSIQEAARELRYQWFSEILQEWRESAPAAHYMLTAHHADDNIETAMMHFFRGTGLQGMAGIQPVRQERQLLRPLLWAHKQELKTYAAENNLAFVEDSSNAADKYTRNFFRNRLIPEIKEIFPRVEENLAENLVRMREAYTLYQQAVTQQLKKLVTEKNKEIHIPVLKLKKTEPLHTITWELIKPYGFSAHQTDDVLALLDAANGAYVPSNTHRIIRNRQWLIITTLATQVSAHIVVEKGISEIDFAEGSIKISSANVPAEIPADPLTACIDAEKITFPLVLRPWKQGDYFYPLGMKKKKKLSRFFIDQKLSRIDKEKAWVLESDKKIVWILGHRIDDRFKISPATTTVLLIRYLK